MRVICFGLANDKAKPLTWRREDIPTPVQLLDDPDLVAELETGIEGIEAIYAALLAALRRLASALLETETKKPDAKDISRLQSRMTARAGYWLGVEPGFHRFLQSIASESRHEWLEEARRMAARGLERAADAIGGTSRRWRALALAKRELSKSLRNVAPPSSTTLSSPAPIEGSA
jgi:hypothetical protein